MVVAPCSNIIHQQAGCLDQRFGTGFLESPKPSSRSLGPPKGLRTSPGATDHNKEGVAWVP